MVGAEFVELKVLWDSEKRGLSGSTLFGAICMRVCLRHFDLELRS
jgi:hypothetical protein